MTKRCHFLKCRQPFEPSHNRQVYCCDDCNKKSLQWTKARGSRLVQPLVAGDFETLRKMRRELIKELNNETLHR